MEICDMDIIKGRICLKELEICLETCGQPYIIIHYFHQQNNDKRTKQTNTKTFVVALKKAILNGSEEPYLNFSGPL